LAGKREGHQGTDLLRSLIQLPREASVKELLDMTTSLTQKDVSEPPDPIFDRLRLEAAMLAYHSATLMQVFNDALDQQQALDAHYITSSGSFDRLAQARNAISEDPQLAWLLLDEFREAWKYQTINGSLCG
jgi:hypothetical protein